MLALFGAQGLVVVDPRLPAFRAAARPVLDRYLARAGRTLAAAAPDGGRVARGPTARGGRCPTPRSSRSSSAIEDGVRRKLTPAEARGAAGQAGALAQRRAAAGRAGRGASRRVAMACGPGEIAYLAQLREVFEGLGVAAGLPGAAPRA